MGRSFFCRRRPETYGRATAEPKTSVSGCTPADERSDDTGPQDEKRTEGRITAPRQPGSVAMDFMRRRSPRRSFGTEPRHNFGADRKWSCAASMDSGFPSTVVPPCITGAMLHPELLRRLCLAREWLSEEAEPLPPVKTIARRAGLSPYHFIRLFKAVFGATPHQYRSHARIERAKELLILSDQSVTEVCMIVGFSSVGSFSALFTRRVGVSPSAWQRRHRAAPGAPRRMPAELIPGCFALMGATPAQKRNFREARRARR